MMKSMTGFGKASGEISEKKITIELKSLNSRQLDLNIRIPGVYREKEGEIRAELSKQLERGKIDFSIYVESTGVEGALNMNKTLAKSYFNELQALANELNDEKTALLPTVLKLPDVFKAERIEMDELEWLQVRKLIDETIRNFQTFRLDEGAVLAQEFKQRIGLIESLLSQVITLDAKRIPALRERLLKAVSELQDKVDMNRFEQELIYYIEKLDISEEKLRLKTHLDYFVRSSVESSSGRKLGFITQEIGREINTIGSKANDAGIQQLVVQMKDELEKIKEQLLNVL